MIDIGGLQALRSVSTLGSIARAAAELGYTASAVSQRLKRLEQQVGVPLLATAGRGVVLTPAGQALVIASSDVFASLERSAEAARSAAQGQPSGVLRVVAFSTAIRGLLAPKLPALAAVAPELRLDLTEQDPEAAIQALTSGTADVAIVHGADGRPARLPATVAQRQIHTDVGDLVLHASHELAKAATLTSADLAGQQWVTSPPGTVCHQWFQRLLATHPGQPEVRHLVDDFATQLALVAAGEVIALIPRLARPPLSEELVVCAVEPPPTRLISVAWRRSAEDSPAIRTMVELLGPGRNIRSEAPVRVEHEGNHASGVRGAARSR